MYVFNRQLVKEQVEAQFQCFTLVDIYGITYYPLAAELGEDGHSVTLTFTDFNNAFETCHAKYTPGTVQTMADDYLVAVSCAFTPQNLKPSPFRHRKWSTFGMSEVRAWQKETAEDRHSVCQSR